jgi:hydroxyacylglutathione hydrolase
MRIVRMEVGALATNTYLLKDDESAEGVVIDPGAEGDRIARRCADMGLAPLYIINTHAHADHIGGNSALKDAFPSAQICVSRITAMRLVDSDTQLSIPLGDVRPSPPPNMILKAGAELTFGAGLLRVLAAPGHLPGSICLLAPGETPQHLFCGDLVFRDSVGRTDLPGGDLALLKASIRDSVLSLPDETVLHPGHGPETTVGRERRHNPYVT